MLFQWRVQDTNITVELFEKILDRNMVISYHPKNKFAYEIVIEIIITYSIRRSIMSIENVLETDVLVIGGGIAGCFSAIKAKEQGMEKKET